ncbi:MAG: S1/P1 nuclease [Candidatus Rariloculaceae bacterium]
MSTRIPVALSLLSSAFLVDLPRAEAFGAEGHRIGGLVAEMSLCAQARTEVDSLAGEESLADIGIWADRIRGLPRWEHTGPWHYMNIPDGMSLSEYQTPSGGDILWAIDFFRQRLADLSEPPDSRGEALKFFIHFIVDLHQPLHVGRETDRGGTLTEIHLGEDTISLHRFWDTDAIPNNGLPAERYAASISALAATPAAEEVPGDPVDWARESQLLRNAVYAFDTISGRIDARYRERAGEIVQDRLVKAGIRLAAELNDVFCAGD